MSKKLSDNFYNGVTPIANGGTGANTASGALTSLGIQPKLVSGTNIKTINNKSVLSTAIQFGNLVSTDIKTANYTAVSNDLVRCNTTAGSFNVTLPASPSDGTIIGINDTNNTFSAYPVSLLPNTATIENDTLLYLNMPNSNISIIYNAFNNNWQVLKTRALTWYGAPPPPISVSATVANRIATITYTAPTVNNIGVAISSYIATSTPGNLTGTVSQSGSGTINVSGLLDNTTYTFTVVASNGSSSSVPSNASNSVRISPPDQPSIGTVTVSYRDVTIPIVQPTNNNGSVITGYTVTSSPAGITGTLNQAGSGNLVLTVTGSQAYISYTFTVTATNAAGTSIASTASNSVTPTLLPPTSVEYVVVAGGGAGGIYVGGGGGAGGLLSGSYTVTPSTSYTATVGAGGVNGDNSSFGNVSALITALGGGRGAYYSNGDNPAVTGGSGGGGSDTGTVANRNGVAGTAGQGNSGGHGSTLGSVGGGGGGAGGSGSNGTGSGSPGAGGSGATTFIGTIAGGGGGYRFSSGTVAAGQGGGGNGASYGSSIVAGYGLSNTGGGGGGNYNTGWGYGGSGVVGIRYLNIYKAATTQGNPTITDDGTYRIYKFTASGSITF
jgi:hypothetical protein